MNLYIIRHAIAVEAGTPGYNDDRLRPLTEAGRQKMGKIAHGLKILALKCDLLLSSPYVRARETAKILAAEFDLPANGLVLSDNLTPLAAPEQLLAEINAHAARVEHLAIVGHEPNLSLLISLLTTGNTSLGIVMKKGGACCLAGENFPVHGRARLEWLLTPRQLAAIGERG